MTTPGMFPCLQRFYRNLVICCRKLFAVPFDPSANTAILSCMNEDRSHHFSKKTVRCACGYER